ncbi:nuclease-related domain-containing protein [Bacillus sp. FJAT-49736]|uniref:nuclease-related domain-containing protein n=1 Tax=Bacillus sp. FJAT-49736 TaxID=2833582 RepID=UPI001BCA47E2|nr:nuclease-related domain-containing protein [Bacillus sp. FJAT-49736]MBS4174279.1 NERD domain-containing protein [Bacillus sp. FJAT-49736]
MIVKERDFPIKIRKLEALHRRIPPLHPKRSVILDELARRRSGHYGEESLDYHLSFLNDKKYHILHTLRLLNNQKHHFQIDTLILSSSFIAIIEVKSHGGTIIFDHRLQQLIHRNGDKERAYQDPIIQVKRHQLQWREWLKRHKFPNIPILPLIIISNPSTIIKTIGPFKEYQWIIRSSNLIFEFQKYEQMYHNESITKKDITKLSRLLIKNHLSEDYDVLKKFNIDESELLTGVHCPKCSSIPMKRSAGNWVCTACSYSSKTAHSDTLKDYTLLIQTNTTKRDLQKFLHLDSRMVMTNIIKALNLPGFGQGKARIYQLDELL